MSTAKSGQERPLRVALLRVRIKHTPDHYSQSSGVDPTTVFGQKCVSLAFKVTYVLVTEDLKR